MVKYFISANDDDFICDFCSLEFPTSSERTEHILQHFQQSICSGCGDTLICIGDTWYGPHTDFNCCAANTDDAQIDNELMLPDFMEVKKEEIVDVEEQAEVVSVEEEEIYVHDEGSNDILEDDELNEKEPDETFTMIIPDEEAANVERYEASNNSSVDKTNVELATKIHNKCMDMNKGNQYKMTLIHHKNKCIGFKAVPNKKNPSTASVINGSEFMDSEPAHDSFAYIHGEEVVTSLTKEQLSNRQCPICGKIIVNRQNLICHMNIHSGRKPFICEVCEKSFAHIRNLIRHKEQQGKLHRILFNMIKKN